MNPIPISRKGFSIILYLLFQLSNKLRILWEQFPLTLLALSVPLHVYPLQNIWMPDGIYIVDSWDHWQLQGSKSAVPFQFSAMHAEPGVVKNNNNTDTYTLLVFLIRTKHMI